MYAVNMASSCTDEEAPLVYLDDLYNISTLLNKDNNLEEKITPLFIEVSTLFSILKKKPQPISL